MRTLRLILAVWLALFCVSLPSEALTPSQDLLLFGSATSLFPSPSTNILSSKIYTPGGSVGGSGLTFAQLGYAEGPYTAVKACWLNTLSTPWYIDGLMAAPTSVANDGISPLNAVGAAESFTSYSGPLNITVPAAATTGSGGVPGIACSGWILIASLTRTDNAAYPPLVMVRYHTLSGYNSSSASPTTAQMTQFGGVTTVSSGTYNSGTGAVSLTLAGSLNLGAVGTAIGNISLTGTGSVASLNGPGFVTATGTTGTTLNYTAATGLTLTIAGGTVANANVTPGPRVEQGYWKSQTIANFQTPSNLTAPTNGLPSMILQFQSTSPGATVLACGDSTTQGVNSTGLFKPWGELAAESVSTLLAPVQFFNGAFAGATTAQIYASCPDYITAVRPNIVLLQVWSVNDSGAQAQANIDIARTTAFAKRLKASGIQPILITALCAGSLSAANDLIRLSINTWIKTQSGYPYIDSSSVYCTGSGPQTIVAAYNSGDNTHPNDLGEAAIAAVAAPVISGYVP